MPGECASLAPLAKARMQAIVRLQLQTLKAEFPSYEFLQNLRVFHLERSSTPSAENVAKMAQSIDMVRLASSCKGKLVDLQAQFLDHFLMAMREFKLKPGISSFEAWKQALARTRATGRHPQAALIEVLMRYGACIGCTTPGAEQLPASVSITCQHLASKTDIGKSQGHARTTCSVHR